MGLMNLETRDVLTLLSIVVAAISIVLVSRNARKATAVQAQNVDLTRMRDLRHELSETRAELRETRKELHEVKSQASELAAQVTATNEAMTAAYRQRAEMLIYARMPGVTIDDWLRHFDQEPPELNPLGGGKIER
jgi:septal ring factor EnvC (AmiA/AmiB activator)